MSDVKKLTDQISVSPFVRPSELAALAGEFRTIVNNRPDGEEPGQEPSAELAAEAEKLGLDYRHIPVVPGQLRGDQIEQFAQVLEQAGGPVLAFCRTGTRSTMLWALSQVGKRSADDILVTAKAAGYDLSALAPMLQGRHAR